MPRRLLALLPLLLLLLVAPPGCGGGGTSAQDRPELVDSNPPSGAIVPTGLSVVRLTFDEPVRLFLTYQLQILRDGVLLPGIVYQLPGEATSVRVVLAAGEAFSPGAYELRVNEGLVLNSEEHYALEPEVVSFQVAGSPALFVGSPTSDTVTALDADTLLPVSSTPTPGARDPIGILAQRQGADTRVFVQLATGGGSGQALAHHLLGAGAMTPVPLTTSGGDLAAAHPALTLDPQGDVLYVAYRDVLAQQVRVARVRTSDGSETGSVLLSIPAAADTLPTALSLREGTPPTLFVTARSGGQGYVAEVDAGTFTETDQDDLLAGVQARALGVPAGPAGLAGDALLVAPLGAATADLNVLSLSDGTVTPQPALQPGAPTCLRVGYDGLIALEGLFAGPADELLALRRTADLASVTPVDVTDDVGGLDQGATRVHALGQVPAQRSVYVLLDADCLAVFAWDDATLTQIDLDALTLGVQVVKLTGSAAGATCVGTVEGSLP